MMDNADRISVVTLARPYIPLAAPPDGAIDPNDRALLSHGYAGILAAHPIPFASVRWAMAIARRSTIAVRQLDMINVAPIPCLAVMPL